MTSSEKIKHSLLHPPIDDLLEMGSEDGSSFYLFDIKKLPIGKWYIYSGGVLKIAAFSNTIILMKE